MRKFLASVISIFSLGSGSTIAAPEKAVFDPPHNETILAYEFLAEMYRDGYFPDFLVDKGKYILLRLCSEIESEKPKSDEDVYRLTHKATKGFNKLALEFEENESEIETAARDTIGSDIDFIMKTYGFDLDMEEAIAPRDW